MVFPRNNFPHRSENNFSASGQEKSIIRVKVRAYADLQGYLLEKKEELVIELKGGSIIRDLMEFLKLPQHRVMLILKNEKKAKEEELLCDGDSVYFYPVIGGG